MRHAAQPFIRVFWKESHPPRATDTWTMFTAVSLIQTRIAHPKVNFSPPVPLIPPSTHEFSPRSSPRSRLSPAALRSFFAFGRIHACCVTKFRGNRISFRFLPTPTRYICHPRARARHRVERNSIGVEWTRVQEWFSNNRAKLRQSVYPTRFNEETLQGSNNVSRYAVCIIRDYPLRNHVPAINSSLSLFLSEL